VIHFERNQIRNGIALPGIGVVMTELQRSKLILFTVFLLLMVMSLLHALPANAQASDEIVRVIRIKAIENNIDPNLAVAIATVESNLNPGARGSLGEIGLFQLRPEFHDVTPGKFEANVSVAMKYLAEIQKKWEPIYGDAWFIKFNLGPNYKRINYPKLFPYYVKVMKAKSQTTIASNQ
jgi:soluble lytic murein transglycosylase-like protein